MPLWIVHAIFVSLSFFSYVGIFRKTGASAESSVNKFERLQMVLTLFFSVSLVTSYVISFFKIVFVLFLFTVLINLFFYPPFFTFTSFPSCRFLLTLSFLFHLPPSALATLLPPFSTHLHLQWTCWTLAWPRTPLSSTSSLTTISCCPFQTSSTAWHPSMTAWSRSTKTWSMCHSASTWVSTGCWMSMTRMYASCVAFRTEDYESVSIFCFFYIVIKFNWINNLTKLFRGPWCCLFMHLNS